MIDDLPNSYDAAHSSDAAPPGLDSAAWERVQLAVDRDRAGGVDRERGPPVGRAHLEVAGRRRREHEIAERQQRLGARAAVDGERGDVERRVGDFEVVRGEKDS